MFVWFGSGFIYARLNINQYIDEAMQKENRLGAELGVTFGAEHRETIDEGVRNAVDISFTSVLRAGTLPRGVNNI